MADGIVDTVENFKKVIRWLVYFLVMAFLTEFSVHVIKCCKILERLGFSSFCSNALLECLTVDIGWAGGRNRYNFGGEKEDRDGV